METEKIIQSSIREYAEKIYKGDGKDKQKHIDSIVKEVTDSKNLAVLLNIVCYNTQEALALSEAPFEQQLKTIADKFSRYIEEVRKDEKSKTVKQIVDGLTKQ